MKWNIDYIEHAAKAILYLLRDRFLVATDYDQMRKVFLEEPCLLHTADVQSAFIHLAIKKADPKAIPAMNQRYYPNKASDQLRTDHKLIPNRKQTFLETIGVKDISLTLSIPSNLQLVRRKKKQKNEEKFRLFFVVKDVGTKQDFDVRSIIVEIQVYGGGEKIGDVSTGSLPVLRPFPIDSFVVLKNVDRFLFRKT